MFVKRKVVMIAAALALTHSVLALADVIANNQEYEPIAIESTEVIEPIEKVIALDTVKVKEPVLKSLGEFRLTAYCSCEICCGKWAKYNTTKFGTTPEEGRTIAVDDDLIPLGTIVIIDGVEYVAEDTGSAIKKNRIDVYHDSHEAAKRFGVQYKEVFVRR